MQREADKICHSNENILFCTTHHICTPYGAHILDLLRQQPRATHTHTQGTSYIKTTVSGYSLCTRRRNRPHRHQLFGYVRKPSGLIPLLAKCRRGKSTTETNRNQSRTSAGTQSHPHNLHRHRLTAVR